MFFEYSLEGGISSCFALHMFRTTDAAFVYACSPPSHCPPSPTTAPFIHNTHKHTHTQSFHDFLNRQNQAELRKQKKIQNLRDKQAAAATPRLPLALSALAA